MNEERTYFDYYFFSISNPACVYELGKESVSTVLAGLTEGRVTAVPADDGGNS